jgi:hypothetical protein
VAVTLGRRAVAALLAGAGCTNSPRPPAATREPPSHPAVAHDAAPAAGDHAMAMIDLARDLHRFLSQDPLTIADIATRVGPITSDPGVPMEIQLSPVIPGVSAARLARYPDSGLPFTLTLEPTPDARPTAAALRGTFGEGRRGLTDRGRPPELQFDPPAAGPRWHVVVIAELDGLGGAAGIDAARAIRIVFRRDPVSP